MFCIAPKALADEQALHPLTTACYSSDPPPLSGPHPNLALTLALTPTLTLAPNPNQISLENIVCYSNKGKEPFTSVPPSYYFIFTLKATK